MQPLAIGQARSQRLELLVAGLHECGPQQQVFRRVTGERQLGRDDHARALRMRTAGRRGDLGCVASQVAHRRVDLGQGDQDGA